MSNELLHQELEILRQRNAELEQQVVELTHANLALETVIDGIADPIFVKDEQHQWILVNDALCEFMGFAKTDLLGKSDYDFFPEEQARIFWATDEIVLSTGAENLNEELATDAQGNLRVISTQKTCFQNAAGKRFLIGSFRDITEFKKVQQASQQAKEELEARVEARTIELQQTVAQLQHEIRDREHALLERNQAEEALRHKNSELQAIFRALPDLYFRMDWNGMILDFQAGSVSNLYVPPEEFLGKTMPDYLPPDVGQQFNRAIARVQQTRSLVSIEYKLQMPEGKQSFEARLLPLGDDQLIAFIRDISERKAVEAELRKQEKFLRTIYDGVEHLIFVGDVLETGEIRQVGCNLAAERIIGLSSSEIAGKTLEEVFGSAEAQKIQQRYQACVAAGVPVTYEECITLNQQENWWLSTYNPLRDKDGRIYRIVCTTFDISDRKKVEEALRNSEQRFRDVSEAAGEYLWELDADGKYTFVTDKVSAVKGYQPLELLGHSPFEFMLPADIQPVQEILHHASTAKCNFRLQHRDITPTGETVWEEVNGVPLLNQNGEVIGFRGAGLSITDRKQAEEALRRSEAQLRLQAQDLKATLRELQRTQSQLVQSEKMSSLGQLVAGVAHEINNPVNFIYGNLTHANGYINDLLGLLDLYQQHYPQPVAEIAQESEAIDLDFLVQDLPKLLASMKVGADRIQKIVTSLRNFSRMDEAEFKEVDIHDGIDSTLMILQNRLKTKHVRIEGKEYLRPEITLIKEYGQLPLIECYAGQLNQVFMNILSNAIDALDESKFEHANWKNQEQNAELPVPTIRIQTKLLNSDKVEIRIADNGAGIPETVRQRLFDPFFTTKPVGKGTGMGLSISYQIVTERHYGSLRCISAPQQGAEFVIEIPVRQQLKTVNPNDPSTKS